MKKIILLILCLFIGLKGVSAEVISYIAPNSKSAILIEASTGKILYEKNSHERYAPASMTKIMSMILIMEEIEKGNLKWNDTLVASEYAASMGGSQIFLQPNEKMSVKDLFKAVAIGSANDAVVVKKQLQVIREEIII